MKKLPQQKPKAKHYGKKWQSEIGEQQRESLKKTYEAGNLNPMIRPIEFSVGIGNLNKQVYSP